MKAIFKILLWLAGAMGALLLVSFFLPKIVHLERTVIIQAKPSTVYALINDLTTYDKWMTWNQLDSDRKIEYPTQTGGVGAWYKWESHDGIVGKGKLTISENLPEEKVITKMEFAHFLGPCELIPKGYAIISECLKQHQKTSSQPPYKIYIDNPGVEKIPIQGKPILFFLYNKEGLFACLPFDAGQP